MQFSAGLIRLMAQVRPPRTGPVKPTGAATTFSEFAILSVSQESNLYFASDFEYDR